MMSNTFRNRRASELTHLAQILKKNRILNDPSPIHKAASECQNYSDDNWGYSIDKLIFRISDRIKTIPTKVENLTIELSLSVRGKCWNDSELIHTDPFNSYQYEVLIQGLIEDQVIDDYKPIKCSWHLDRHIDDENSNVSHFFHPQYHFQFGGYALKDLNSKNVDQSSILILDTPRLPHPPMDGLIGIDFILANFFDKSMLNFRNEGDYANPLEKMQTQIWCSYVNAISSKWLKNSHSVAWKANLLWPQLY